MHWVLVKYVAELKSLFGRYALNLYGHQPMYLGLLKRHASWHSRYVLKIDEMYLRWVGRIHRHIQMALDRPLLIKSGFSVTQKVKKIFDVH